MGNVLRIVLQKLSSVVKWHSAQKEQPSTGPNNCGTKLESILRSRGQPRIVRHAHNCDKGYTVERRARQSPLSLLHAMIRKGNICELAACPEKRTRILERQIDAQGGRRRKESKIFEELFSFGVLNGRNRDCPYDTTVPQKLLQWL